MSEIHSKVLKTISIDWQKVKWFQNENLKQLSEEGMEKLKRSLKTNGFVMPFHVWEDTAKKERWILDGHHRQRALEELLSEGVNIPNQLPATFINCKDEKEAAKFVLLYTSQYAKITNVGLDDFMQLYDIELEEFREEIDLPEFSLPRFEQQFNPIMMSEEINEIDSLVNNVEIVVKHGDLFELGPHRLLCGDALNADNWKKLLNGKKARMVFTDPPYNLPANYIGNKGTQKHKDFAFASGEMTDVEFKDF